MTDDPSDDFAPPPMAQAWVVEEAWEIGSTGGDSSEEPLVSRVVNDGAVWAERRRQWKENAPGDTFMGGFRYEHFATIPHVAVPSFPALDWMHADGLELVSPRLFALLDQPAGSLQGIPAETEWLGPDVPDWSYVWLAYVPVLPALDLDRSEGELEWIVRGGKRGQVLRTLTVERLQLRDGIAFPCGLFSAAEADSLIMATDAVAAAVLRVGCTGLEFRHPGAELSSGTWFRRGLDGVELHPRDVALLEAQTNPAPDEELDITLPPLGPAVRWDHSLMDWFNWTQADKNLSLDPAPEGGDAAWMVSDFIVGQLFNSTSAIEAILAAVRGAQAGQTDLWTYDLPDMVVLVRPDALWLKNKHSSETPEPLPLDGMEAVLARWREAIRHAPDPFAPKG